MRKEFRAACTICLANSNCCGNWTGSSIAPCTTPLKATKRRWQHGRRNAGVGRESSVFSEAPVWMLCFESCVPREIRRDVLLGTCDWRLTTEIGSPETSSRAQGYACAASRQRTGQRRCRSDSVQGRCLARLRYDRSSAPDPRSLQKTQSGSRRLQHVLSHRSTRRETFRIETLAGTLARVKSHPISCRQPPWFQAQPESCGVQPRPWIYVSVPNRCRISADVEGRRACAAAARASRTAR